MNPFSQFKDVIDTMNGGDTLASDYQETSPLRSGIVAYAAENIASVLMRSHGTTWETQEQERQTTENIPETTTQVEVTPQMAAEVVAEAERILQDEDMAAEARRIIEDAHLTITAPELQ